MGLEPPFPGTYYYVVFRSCQWEKFLSELLDSKWSKRLYRGQVLQEEWTSSYLLLVVNVKPVHLVRLNRDK